MDPPATAGPAAGSPSTTSSSLRRRAALSVNTSAPDGRGMERESKEADEGERDVERAEPVSPAGRLFREAHFNCYIVALLGLGAPVDVPAARAGLDATLARHPRFCSVQDANTPMLSSKLPHLKNLEIILLRHYFSPNYDVFSLVSFLDASLALESFILRLEQDALMQVPGVGDNDEYQRQNLECRHNSLRKVTITGFCSAKSLVELIVHILDRTHSLERLTLDTTYGYDRWTCNIGKFPTARIIGHCRTMSKRALEEAHRAVEAAGRYIKEIVPSSVQFEVLGRVVDAISGSSYW